MTSRQDAQINRFRLVEGVCDAHPAAWSHMPFFVAAKAALSAHLLALGSSIGQQGAGTKGATAQKKSHRKAVESGMVRLAAAVRLSSMVSGDADMAREATVTPSGIQVMSDNTVLGMAVRIQGMAGEIGVDGLLPFGIDAAFLAGFAADLGAFIDHIDGPLQAEVEQRQSTAEIARLLAECRRLLTTDMDPATLLIKDSAPDFYAAYWIAHRIRDAATATRALRVRVLDSATGKPLAKVRAAILPGKIVKMTGPAGQFYVQTLKSGLYSIGLEKDGYVAATAEVRVQKGSRAEVVVRLQREA